ncbi:MAG: hypothetical protein ACO3XO_02720, partial [Bdellovibrionota bacterium]
SIRSRGHFSRTLEPLDRGEQLRWEYGNYIAALLMLLLTFVCYRNLREKKRLRQKHLLESLS